ncbi:MAG: hypothetical protein HY744_18010 [Deltaproteobacteria bacterium]|nr:hypothetical protein [Deltaproteobacteria bacterium]
MNGYSERQRSSPPAWRRSWLRAAARSCPRAALAGPPLPGDLLPADLDLVLRFDLGRLRAALGPEPSQELSAQALGRAPDEGLVREALRAADVVWLGLRAADLEAGDRVLVVEAAAAPVPDPIAWKPLPSGRTGVRLFDSRTPAPRDGTSRIVKVGERVLAFVSPVEVASVSRVLRDGPDARRRQPAAAGLVSVDWRGRRLSPLLENRYPALASVLGSIAELRASVELVGADLNLDARVGCKDPGAAARVERVLKTIGAAAPQLPQHAELLRALALSRAESTVQVHWPLPRQAVLAALRALPGGPAGEPSAASSREP